MKQLTIKILEQVKSGRLPVQLAQEQLFSLFGLDINYKPQRNESGGDFRDDSNIETQKEYYGK